MKPLLLLLCLFCTVHAGLLVLSIAEGFAIHWLLPSVDLGSGVLVGVIASAITIYFVARLIIFIVTVSSRAENDDEEPAVEFNPKAWAAYYAGQRRRRRER